MINDSRNAVPADIDNLSKSTAHMFDNMSMLTVAELTADLELGLELVAGHRGADREIEAAAVSELAHPGPWLQGGELLLTIGLLLPDTTDACRSYLAELDAAGVRAVGLGLGAELPHQRAPDTADHGRRRRSGCRC